ncbi:MAG: hypothetical protein NT130_02625 [Candidatus Micrarchaeota archaeon]|nr:hypothetical protein [Candidatus Micrarchaeota archaeon]
MRCFKHPKSEAVGICSSCNKGVCSKCAVEEDGKVYCRDCLSRSKIVDRCYNHPRSEAIGMCSSCKKLICADCAIEKDDKLYCRLCSAKIPAEFEVPTPTDIVEVQQKRYEERGMPIARTEERIPARFEARRIPVSRVELSVKPSETVSSTIVGGIVGGFLMGLPFINFLLIWPAIGGAVSAYLLRLRVDRCGNGYINRRNALEVGAISGVFAALIATTFNIIYTVLFEGLAHQAETTLNSWLDIGIADLLVKFAFTDLSLSSIFILPKLIATIVLFALLGAVGGAISAEFSKR